MTAPSAILLVEDDPRFRQRLARALRDRGFVVEEAASLDEARTACDRQVPDHLLLDLRLGETWTLEFIDEARARWPALEITVLTGYGSIATALDAVRRGARHYLTKPADIDQVLAVLGGQPSGAAVAPDEAVPMSLSRLEWEHINRVLTECDGNISAAARVLGLHRRSLQRKLAKFPLPR